MREIAESEREFEPGTELSRNWDRNGIEQGIGIGTGLSKEFGDRNGISQGSRDGDKSMAVKKKMTRNYAAILAFAVSITALSALPGAQAKEAESSNDLMNLKNKALPPTPEGKTALSYHRIPIDLKSDLSKEKLVDLCSYGVAGESYYARRDGFNAPYYRSVCAGDKKQKLRKTAAVKLESVNKRLACLGLELFVFDAYRPVSCQKQLWDYSISEARRMLAKSANEEDLVEYAGKFCSNPGLFKKSDWKTWPTHLTGGAVDLTIRRKSSGELLYMGSIFDDNSELSFSAFFEKKNSDKNQKLSSSEICAMQNRRLLYWLMTEEGFANYPNEWWHFDFGNQMWVQNSRNPLEKKAAYGAI